MERKVCPKCGTVVQLNTKFCSTCGYMFTENIVYPSPPPQMPPMTVPALAKTKYLRLFGIVGLLSLVILWDAGFWLQGPYSPEPGGFVEWLLFDYLWVGPIRQFVFVFENITASNLILIAAFVLVLVGSILLLLRMRVGGILLVVSAGLWAIYYVINFISSSIVVIAVPVGALLCGIVGVISLIYRK
jgi:hypothetical protein